MTQALTVNDRKLPTGVTRYGTSIHGQPMYEGANDPRMGDLHNNFDPGHFGHIELARPVYHQGFSANVVLKSLRCICFHCSRIVVDIENNFKCRKAVANIHNHKRRLAEIKNLLRNKNKCEHCHGLLLKYTKVGLHLETE